MDKISAHLKKNASIYLILLVCLVAIIIALILSNQKEEEMEIAKVDTSLFKVVTLEEALNFFESDEPVFLVVGLETCSATINYVPYLKIAEAKYGFQVYYLELSSIDSSQIDTLNKFIEKLDVDYKLKDKVDKFGKFIETTPATIIIKNRKQVFGYYGSMNTSTIETIAGKYGLILYD